MMMGDYFAIVYFCSVSFCSKAKDVFNTIDTARIGKLSSQDVSAVHCIVYCILEFFLAN